MFTFIRLIPAVTLVLLNTEFFYCWQKWEFAAYSSDKWRELWSLADGPGERRGHSLVLFNKTKIILFGGRGNEAHRQHVPSRFDVVEDRGILKFSTYDGMPLSASFDGDSAFCKPVETCVTLTNATSGSRETCSYSWKHLLQGDPSLRQQAKIEEMCGFVPVGVFYNDVWIYDTDCLRYADLACADDGWRIMHPGIKYGGCDYEQGEHQCLAPSERYGHGASMLDETTLAIYGGYSQECEDYCSDLWLFDLNSLEWTQRNSTVNPGHRLWHGFSSNNNVENRWQGRELLPEGGYLNDLWIYRNNPQNIHEKYWTKIEGKETCVAAPGLTWESRNDKRCEVYWPKVRSGHAATYDNKRNGIWVHGGYSTYYPYPTNKDSGSGHGVNALGQRYITIHPTYDFYLDDLWFYNITSGYWEKKRIFGRKPHRRTDHIIVLAGDIIILHGGYADNYYFNDTWYYIIGENRWLEKVHFIHANYPLTCTDDLIEIQKDPRCIELKFPEDLRRSNESTLALNYQEIIPFSEQSGYTPDPNYPNYFGIVDNAEEFVKELHQKYIKHEVYDKKGRRIWVESGIPDGTPIAPKAATAPRQYARKTNIQYNDTTVLEVWEWCTSVKGEPTKYRVDDGIFGRSNTSVLIPQPRRQSIGWDGCDGTQWKYPSSRSDHASVYVEKYNMIVTHGGMGYNQNNTIPSYPARDMTPDINVLGDMWVFILSNCAKNCSNNGVCTNGFCKCDPGFYGIDCSNFTCPGSVCHYDKNNFQHCSHCCFDSTNDRKIPCRIDEEEIMSFTGKSEGVCDGFGTCQCAPPYIGEDCSILDCKNNCSFNGYCSVEFPVSRCMCKNGYTGEYCQHFECLNNCSFPNGVCNQETGKCSCSNLYSPYDRHKLWDTWHGEDCSYLPAWSKAYQSGLMWDESLVVLFGLLVILIVQY